MKELFKEESSGDYRFRWYVMPDDTPVQGNALASGDEAEDKRYEGAILRRLDRGDVWAWCVVECECTHTSSGIKGSDYLGGCTYEDAKEFLFTFGHDGWDMIKNSREACEAECERLRKALCHV